MWPHLVHCHVSPVFNAASVIVGAGVWHSGQEVVMTHDGACPAARLFCLAQGLRPWPRGCAKRHRRAALWPLRYETRSTTVLIVIALIVVALTIAVALRRYRPGNSADLGWVTERWLAEYRADSSRPSR